MPQDVKDRSFCIERRSVIHGDLKCDGRLVFIKEKVIVEGDVDAWTIEAGDLDARDIIGRIIHAGRIKARDVIGRDIDAFKITARNLSALNVKGGDVIISGKIDVSGNLQSCVQKGEVC